MVVSKLMKEEGIALEEAENGKVAVESVKKGKSYDLILMDREMSVMYGHEVSCICLLCSIFPFSLAVHCSASDASIFPSHHA